MTSIRKIDDDVLSLGESTGNKETEVIRVSLLSDERRETEVRDEEGGESVFDEAASHISLSDLNTPKTVKN